MIVLGLLGPLFLSPEEILSDTAIEEIERVGGVDLNDLVRTHLREIVRDYLSKRVRTPPTQVAARRMKRLEKSPLKAQKLRQEKLASALEKAAALLEEELRPGILFVTSLNFKVVSLNIPCPISLPQTVQYIRALAGAARVKQDATEQTDPWRKGSRGRPPDGLNDLIQQFAIVYLVSGGKLTSGTDPDTGHGRITPVIKAAKALIDALPEDCPRLSLAAIADRVKGQKLFAQIKQGGKTPRK